jgi:hypothetical protein
MYSQETIIELKGAVKFFMIVLPAALLPQKIYPCAKVICQLYNRSMGVRGKKLIFPCVILFKGRKYDDDTCGCFGRNCCVRLFLRCPQTNPVHL